MPRYAIALQDPDVTKDFGNVYWTTRVVDTDNYTTDKNEATLFPDSTCAKCLMRVLDMTEDHTVVGLDTPTH